MNKPVVIGSSTGGTQALEVVLTALPADSPGVAIVQHMPEKFTAMYAQRLNGLCAVNVREARDGERDAEPVRLLTRAGEPLDVVGWVTLVGALGDPVEGALDVVEAEKKRMGQTGRTRHSQDLA